MVAGFLLDDPFRFFRKKKPSFSKTIIYVIEISAIFSALNQASIFFGLTQSKLTYGHIETFFIIFISLVFGIFIVSLIFSLISLGKINKRSYMLAFYILAYSITPFMLFGWIPHAAVKVALLLWGIAFIIIGIHIKMNKTYKHAVIITVGLLVVITVLSLVSQNFVLAPI
jgi:predicted membrane channel-forming protein YqfA (hemolysin III family)